MKKIESIVSEALGEPVTIIWTLNGNLRIRLSRHAAKEFSEEEMAKWEGVGSEGVVSKLLSAAKDLQHSLNTWRPKNNG